MNVVERGFFFQLVKVAAEKLDLPVDTFSRAALYLHRYMVRFNFPGDVDPYKDNFLTVKTSMTSAALFLSGKETEQIRSVRDVINVVSAVYGMRIEQIDELPTSTKKDVFFWERVLLEKVLMGTVADPSECHYRFLLNLAHVCKLTRGDVGCALGLLNDLFLGPSVLEHEAHVAAAACLRTALVLAVEAEAEAEAQAEAEADTTGATGMATVLAAEAEADAEADAEAEQQLAASVPSAARKALALLDKLVAADEERFKLHGKDLQLGTAIQQAELAVLKAQLAFSADSEGAINGQYSSDNYNRKK